MIQDIVVADGANQPRGTYSVASEKAALGGFFMNDDVDTLISVLGQNAGVFYRELHRDIYVAILSLWRNGVRSLDRSIIEEQMKREGSNQAYSIWTEVDETSPNLAIEHAKIVRDAATLRNIEAAGARAVQIANDPDAMGDVNAALAKARQALENVTTGAGSIQPASSILPAVIDTISRLANGQEMPGIPTRFDCLDTILQGLKRGDLTILAARPAMGKTALALNIARNVLSMDRNVAIFSVEMTGEQLLLRMLAAETAIDSLRLQSGDLSEEEWVFLLEAANNLAESGLYLDDKSFTVADLLHQARQLHREVGLDLVIVDYLQLLDGGASAAKGNRQQEISQISRSLKRLARELNIPVLALSQLSRAVESRADKRPMLSDLRESGAIEQDADRVLFIYREDYYEPDSDRKNIADIIVAKNRHGGVGTAYLYFRKAVASFRDLEIIREDLVY